VAIQFARARYIARSSGGSAVRSAAYNAREAITADRTGELYYFKHRDAPEHHDVLLPEGADTRFAASAVLWNAAEAAEKRKDAQVAREIVLALPADTGISVEDRIALAHAFAEQHFVSKGLAVQLDVHAPHDGAEESERANWHAHLLITTRRLEGEGFSAKKARDLDPEVRRAGGRAVVADGEAWGALWRDHQNRYFQAHGLDCRVDPTATHAGQHIGPVRMRRADTGIAERAELLRQANEAAARDPAQVLATLTRHTATFTERDLNRHLAKHIPAASEWEAVKAQVLEHQDLVPLHDRATGEAAGRFTTQTVRAQEQAALREGEKLTRQHRPPVSEAAARLALMGRTLRPDQQAAFDHAMAGTGLALIVGRAGTGKSFTLAAIRAAHARDGRRVIGLAPTNAVAQDLAKDGFTEAGTVHAALFALKTGRAAWDRKTVVIVDEAAMLDARITGELMTEARKSGAKLILAGDDRQLASIERGGLFTELTQRHGAAEITAVTRQRVDWQRQAAHDLAEGRFAQAVAAFDRAGAITWTNDQVDACQALVAAWSRDTAAAPDAKRFVFAYTNRDVDALNAELRQVRRTQGALSGRDVRFETKHGVADFSAGDRVQFTDTDKRLRIYNGNVGTITGLDARTGQLTATLDGGRVVSWSAADFQGFRHGYAGTIYKGQGKTLDHTYLYHTHHWRSAASYVALTRQRDSAQVFVARETASDASQLAWQMARGEVKAASVAWATREEVGQAQTAREPSIAPSHALRRTQQQDQAEAYWRDRAEPARAEPEDTLKAKVRDTLARRERQASLDAAAPAQPGERPQDALRRELMALDRDRLRAAAQADILNPGFMQRPLTPPDVARQLDPAYAAAADRAERLRKETAEVAKSVAHYEGVLQSNQEAGDRRWQELGFLRQVAHKTGARRDRWLSVNEDREQWASEELGKLDPRRADLAKQLPAAEKAESMTFARIEPVAAAELAQRQCRGAAAREIVQERWQQEREEHAREQQQERLSRGRDRGFGLER
jgi:Ti-type conjugative transfer relaxase TraA